MASFVDTLKLIVGRRWPLIVFFFVVEVAVITLVSSLPFFPGEQSSFENAYNNNLTPVLNSSAPSQVDAILTNNLERIALPELTPAVGLAIYGIAMYGTARSVEAIAVIKGVPVGLALASLFFLPSTWLELPAYAIAAAESVYLARAIYRGFKKGRRYLLGELRFLLVNVLLIAGVLIVAAVFEVSEIQIATTVPGGDLLSLLTWLPFAMLFVLVLSFWRRARRDAPTIEWQDETASPSPVP